MSVSGLMLYFKFLNDGWLSAKLSMNHTMVDFCGMRFLVIFSNNVYDLLWCQLILYADHQNLLGLNSAWKLCWIVESDKFSQHHILLSAERHVESVAWLVTCEKWLLFNYLAEFLLKRLAEILSHTVLYFYYHYLTFITRWGIHDSLRVGLKFL